MYRDKLGAFRKMIGKSAEFKFITAPHRIPPLEDSDKSENGNLVQFFLLTMEKLLGSTVFSFPFN